MLCRSLVLVSACLLAALTLGIGPKPALAQDAPRFTIDEENDFFAGMDRHYTQGAKVTYLSPFVDSSSFADPVYGALDSYLPIFAVGPDVLRKFDVVAGQSIYTPRKYRTFPLDPRDRPFAGWLYTGGSLLQETGGRMLENFELLVGTTGPDSFADVTQQGFHDLIHYNNLQLGQTWKTQIKNEPGIILTYERKWRYWESTLFGLETEIVPEAGLSVGNILTYGQATIMARIGRDLGVDYGPDRVRPSFSGTPWFNGTRITDPFGWYLFAAIQGRAIARNIFLDGNSFETSRSVQKEPLVGSVSFGASAFYKDWVKADFTLTETTQEFKTKEECDHYGAFSVSFKF